MVIAGTEGRMVRLDVAVIDFLRRLSLLLRYIGRGVLSLREQLLLVLELRNSWLIARLGRKWLRGGLELGRRVKLAVLLL